MAKLKSTIRSLSLFLFARFPFVNMITLLMLLGERAQRETYVLLQSKMSNWTFIMSDNKGICVVFRYPPMEPKIIYGHIGVFLICGLCMGFNFKRKEMSLIHSGQLLVMAYSIYMNPTLKYKEWVKVHELLLFH